MTELHSSPTPLDRSEQIARLDAIVAALDHARANPPIPHPDSTPWELFARQCRLLTAQSYGPRFEKYFMHAFGWTKVPSKLNRGDIKDAAGEYYEVKVTMITPSNPGVNFVQLRPHQDIAGYHLFVINPDYTIHHLMVSKKDMNTHIAAMGSSAHGTSTANTVNANKEYAIRFPWTPSEGTAKTWIQDHLAPVPEPSHPLIRWFHPISPVIDS